MTADGKNDDPSSDAEGPIEWLSSTRFAGLLALVFIGSFFGVFIGSETFFRSDYGVIGYPSTFYFRQSVLAGELPLWNPLSNCGAPFLAQWGTMCLYPGALFYVLFPMPWSLGVFSLGHLWFGGVGMFFLARRWTNDPFAASFAGFSFGLSGAVLACLIWPNYCVALGWMPWVVLTTQIAWRDGGRKIPIAALAGTMQMLTGAPELVLLTWLLLLVLGCAEICSISNRVMLVVRFGLVIGIIAALSAIQLLPFFELLEHSQRDASFRDSRWPMPIWGWANLWVPFFHYGITDQGLYVQQGQYFLTSYYPGVIVLALAVLAAWRVRHRNVTIFIVLSIFGLLMALGEGGLIFPALKQLLPGGGMARYPIKFVFLAAFLFPLLAAYGLKRLAEDKAANLASQNRDALRIGVATVVVMLILLALAHVFANPFDQLAQTRANTGARLMLFGFVGFALMRSTENSAPVRQKRLWQMLTLLFLATDLLTHLPRQNPRVPAALYAANQLQSTLKLYPPPIHGKARVMILPETDHRLNLSLPPRLERDYAEKRLNAWSHLNLLDGYAKVNGSSTLRIREQDELERLLYPKTITNAPSAKPITDFLGVAHISATTISNLWEPRFSFMPFVTGGQRPVFADPSTTLSNLVGTNVSLREVVFLSPDDRDKVGELAASKPRIELQSVRAHEIRFTVEAESPALIVIAQSHYPAWRATVNGSAADILRANHAFQAVKVEKGNSEVRLYYRDQQFRTGSIISGIAFAVCLVWLIPVSRKKSVLNGNEQSDESND